MTEKLPAPKKPTVFYAIYNPKNQKYSKGGAGYPTWARYPKTWGLGGFKNHLNLYTTSAYSFPEIGEDESSRYYRFHVKPEQFLKDCLMKADHPYLECEVLEIDSDGLTIAKRHPAKEWIYNNAIKPYYLKRDCVSKRYIERIEHFCKENGITF